MKNIIFIALTAALFVGCAQKEESDPIASSGTPTGDTETTNTGGGETPTTSSNLSVSIDGSVASSLTPYTDTDSFSITGNCNSSSASVTIQVDGVNAVGQSNTTCDGTNFNLTINAAVLSYGLDLSITAVLTEGANSVTSTAHTLNKSPRLPEDSLTSGQFGKAVVISGDHMAIGDPSAQIDVSGFSVGALGAVYTYRRVNGTWSFLSRLTPEDNSTIRGLAAGGGSSLLISTNFGESLDIDGDTLIIGAPGHVEMFDALAPPPANLNIYGTAACGAFSCPRVGGAYIYTFDGTNWSSHEPIQEIASNGAGQGDRYGAAVAVSGDKIMVGAPDADNQVGGVFATQHDGTSWTDGNLTGNSRQVIIPLNSNIGDEFGGQIRMVGNTAVISAIGYQNGAFELVGSALVYKYSSSWSESQSIMASDGAASDQFGFGLAYNGTYLAVGAITKTVGGQSNAGKVYIYEDNGTTFTNEKTIEMSVPENGAQLGRSVGINDTYVVIGASGKEVSSVSNVGSVYVYDHTQATPSLVRTIVPNTTTGSERLGQYMFVEADDLVLGSIGSLDGDGESTGAVFLNKL